MYARATGLSTTCSGTTPPAMRISSITTSASTGCARWRTGTVALEEDGKLGICRQESLTTAVAHIYGQAKTIIALQFAFHRFY